MASVLQNPAQEAPQTVRRSHTGALKLIIGGGVILAVIAFVMFSSFQSNTVYYYHLGELDGQRQSLVGKTIRVNGPLDKSTIQIDQKNLVLTFNLVEGGVVLPVVYKGVIPDTLNSGESVVAEGRLDSNGVFQADTILVKCPSKYEKEGDPAL
jgi:cytochrome c-type biogenesis protein CcmE